MVIVGLLFHSVRCSCWHSNYGLTLKVQMLWKSYIAAEIDSKADPYVYSRSRYLTMMSYLADNHIHCVVLENRKCTVRQAPDRVQ